MALKPRFVRARPRTMDRFKAITRRRARATTLAARDVARVGTTRRTPARAATRIMFATHTSQISALRAAPAKTRATVRREERATTRGDDETLNDVATRTRSEGRATRAMGRERAMND